MSSYYFNPKTEELVTFDPDTGWMILRQIDLADDKLIDMSPDAQIVRTLESGAKVHYAKLKKINQPSSFNRGRIRKTEEQWIEIFNYSVDKTVAETCRHFGISDASFYVAKKKYIQKGLWNPPGVDSPDYQGPKVIYDYRCGKCTRDFKSNLDSENAKCPYCGHLIKDN